MLRICISYFLLLLLPASLFSSNIDGLNYIIERCNAEQKKYAISLINILKKNNFNDPVNISYGKNSINCSMRKLELALLNDTISATKKYDNINPVEIEEYENTVISDFETLMKVPNIDNPTLTYFSKEDGKRIFKFSCKSIEFGKKKIKFIKIPSTEILFASPHFIFY